VICGFGKVGKQTINTMEFHKKDFIVIEKDSQIVDETKKKNTFNIIKGDATKDEILISAGIKHAKSLITVLPSDADNLFVVLTAKSINPNLNIISRASIDSSVPKLKIAGADNVVMPDILGGNHMAQLVSTPDIVEFLNQINIQGNNEVNLEEIGFKNIPDNCKYKSIKDVKNQFENCSIIGYKSPDNEYFINPSDELPILPNSKIFILGTSQQIKELNEALQLITN
jgi:voltage-gated potassium channel